VLDRFDGKTAALETDGDIDLIELTRRRGPSILSGLSSLTQVTG
jgi:hypothetical protein